MDDQTAVDNKAHLLHLKQLMKKQPFWKSALFSVLCIERQWPVYERLSVGREWGNAKDLRKVVDRFWKAIPTGYGIGGSYLAIVQDSLVVPEEDWDALAAEFVQTIEGLFELFDMKDKETASIIAERNLEFLSLFLDFEATGEEDFHPLTKAEHAFQLQLVEKLAAVQNKDKPACVQEYHTQIVGSIIGEMWFADYPDYKPLKHKKPKTSGDGLLFRTSHQRTRNKIKEIRPVFENREKELQALEAYRDAGYQWEPPAVQAKDTDETSSAPKWIPGQSDILKFEQKDYLNFYWSLTRLYENRASFVYLDDQPMEETLQALYQAAQCHLIRERFYCASLSQEEKGQKKGLSYEESIYWAMLIHEYDLAAQLIDRTESASPYKLLLLQLIAGKDEEAGQTLLLCEQSADDLYRGADIKLATALYERDPENIRKGIVQMVKAVRALEDLYLEIFPFYPILACRCAAHMGLEMKSIEVSELPPTLTSTINPFAENNDNIFGVGQIAIPERE